MASTSNFPLSPPKTLKGNQSGSLFSCLIANTLRAQLSNSKVISELLPFCFVCMFIQDNPTKKIWNRVIFLLETKRRLCRQLTVLRPSHVEKRNLEFQKVLKIVKGASIYRFICIFALKYYTHYVKQ